MAARQRLIYCRRDLQAPDELVRAVYHAPQPRVVAEFFARDPGLVLADHLFLAACRVPAYEGHGGPIDEADKHQDERCAIVPLFVEHGADPSLRNKRKVSPLHMACRFDLPRVVTRLLELGAAIDAYDEARETPLFRAVNLGYADCVRALLAHGPDLAFANRKGAYAAAPRRDARQEVDRAAARGGGRRPRAARQGRQAADRLQPQPRDHAGAVIA